MSIHKNPLTARETALRLLEYAQEDISYEDIIRQLRILQDIEHTLNDVDLVGFPGDDFLEEARGKLDEFRDIPDDPRPPSYVLRSGGSKGWKSLEASDEAAERGTDEAADRESDKAADRESEAAALPDSDGERDGGDGQKSHGEWESGDGPADPILRAASWLY